MIGRFAAALAILAGSVAAAAAETGSSTLHHVIDVRLDPAAGRLEAVDQISLGGAGGFEFLLVPWLSVASVTVAGRAVPVVRLGSNQFRLAVSSAANEPLRIAYGGTFNGSVGDARIGPDGVYLPAGSGWLPTDAGSAATYRLSVEVAEPYRAVATGTLADERTESGTYRATFTTEHPSEEPSLSAGVYRIGERWQDSIRLRTYFEAEAAYLAEAYLDTAGVYLDRFHRQIGPYPFRDFHIVSSPLPVGLGFPGLTYISRRVLPLPFMRGRSLAHEVLHNWWGNGVLTDAAGGNWAEGLATYQADYALAAETGVDDARALRLAWLRDYAALPPERDFALRAFTTKQHDASQVVGYNKAAYVFHMVQNEIGTPAFTAALRRFFREYRFRPASWDDLRAAFETASDRNLGWFFHQWLERPGAPSLTLERASSVPAGSGYAVAIAIGQQSPPFRLTVPIAIETASGTVGELIAADGILTEAKLLVGSRPLAVAVDPDFEVFRRLDPEEVPPILRHITLHPDTRVAIAASDADSAAAARRIAERLLDVPPRMIDGGDLSLARSPLLVIGTDAAVGKTLVEAGFGQPPAPVDRPASARVWVGRTAKGRLFAVVTAADRGALEAIAGPLPHYGSMSHLVFEGSRVIAKDASPVHEKRLRRSFSR